MLYVLRSGHTLFKSAQHVEDTGLDGRVFARLKIVLILEIGMKKKLAVRRRHTHIRRF